MADGAHVVLFSDAKQGCGRPAGGGAGKNDGSVVEHNATGMVLAWVSHFVTTITLP